MATVYVDVGHQEIVDYINGVATGPTDLGGSNAHVDWGTGTTGAAAGDTALETPAPEARSIAVATEITTTTTGDTNQWVATITATATRVITEAGLFDSLTAGVLIIRSVFAAINLDSGDKIEFTITLQQT